MQKQPAQRLLLERARLFVGQAGGKGQGVFLVEGLSLEKGTHVMQYGGRASSKDPGNEYTFKMKEDLFLDASKEEYCKEAGAFHLYDTCVLSFFEITTVTGSYARLVNHSCSPNMGARIIRDRVIFVALRALSGNEELTLK